MAADNSIHVRASEYIHALLRRDLQSTNEGWDLLKSELEPGLRADESEFQAVSAQDVIRRHQGRSLWETRSYPDFRLNNSTSRSEKRFQHG